MRRPLQSKHSSTRKTNITLRTWPDSKARALSLRSKPKMGDGRLNRSQGTYRRGPHRGPFYEARLFRICAAIQIGYCRKSQPGLRTVDEAIRRRFNLVPFTVTVPAAERDLELAEKLREEWGGILQWMVDGCLAWQSQGLRRPAVVSEATESYLAAEDALARWIEDRCITGVNYRETTSALFANWQQWASTNEEPCRSRNSSPSIWKRAASQRRGRTLPVGFKNRPEAVTDVTGTAVIPVTRAGERSIGEDLSHPSPEGNSERFRL